MTRPISHIASSSRTSGQAWQPRRWTALTHFIDDGELPIDNNWCENQIRPIALGRSKRLFAGSSAGQ